MNGRLTDHPLAELVHEISEARLSGALRLARERAKAAIYFDGGRLEAALSNLRPLRLVEVLRRAGAVDEARLQALVGEKTSDEQAGVVLMRAGLLDEAGLRQLHARQSREVLRELLRWREGEWSFDPRVRLAGLQKGGQVEAAALLAEAARVLPPEFIAGRTHEDETVAPVEGAQEKAASGFRLLPSEGFILSRVYAPMRLREVFALSGIPEEETRKTVYVLALAGLLDRPQRPRVLPAEKLRQEEELRRAVAERRVSAERAAPGARQTGERAGVPEPAAPGTVEELLALARGATHYEVLGVARTATPDEVKRVYYSHARRLHPDRFRRDADDEQRQRIDAAFAKVAQAYETLKDASLRAAYDLKLSKQGK